jgi:4-hydroxymandelate oxidase
VSPHIDFASRRRLLKFLAASPLFARSALAEGLRQADPADWAPRDLEKLIARARQGPAAAPMKRIGRKNAP